MRDPENLRRASGLLALLLFALILCCPLPQGMPPAALRLAAVTVLMVILWLTQAIPIPATSLIPVMAYPLLGIRTTDAVSSAYLDPTVFLFMGGFMIAIGIERWGLHRRIALHVVRLLGFGPRRMVFGFLTATALLSMWLSNTACTMMMLPITLALLAAIADSLPASSASSPPVDRSAGMQRLGSALLLSIAYGATIGGFATPIGTPTNIAFFGFWGRFAESLPGAPPISVAQWMLVFVPLSAALLAATGIVLTWRMPGLPGTAGLGRGFFRDRLRELGPPSREEWLVLAIFATTAALWILRAEIKLGEETWYVGWGPLVARFLVERFDVDPQLAGRAVHDSTVAIGMAVLMFCLPARRDETGQPRRLLDWEAVEQRMPWGMLLLIGGGFAVADAFDATELSAWIGAQFEQTFRGANVVALVLGVCVLMTFLTEFATNVVVINALLPVLAAASISLGVDPRLLLIPATIAASCGFMLPMGTPPNAIVFSTGRITMREMMARGLVLNLLSIVLTTAFTFALLSPLLGVKLDGAPEWLPAAEERESP